MVRYFAPTLTRLGVLMAHPAAFLVLACYVGAWLAFNPKSFDWQSVATVATWLMTLFIQRAEHRDTQAIHAKLDELLRVEGKARNELTQLDDEEPEVIEQHRSEERPSSREFPLRPFYDPRRCAAAYASRREPKEIPLAESSCNSKKRLFSIGASFNTAAQWTSRQCGRASTFAFACVLIVAWAATGPIFQYSDTWQLVINTGTTIVTFLMVFLIQNTQNRDSAALHLKLDELIRVNKSARNKLLDLEDLTEAELEHLKGASPSLPARDRITPCCAKSPTIWIPPALSSRRQRRRSPPWPTARSSVRLRNRWETCGELRASRGFTDRRRITRKETASCAQRNPPFARSAKHQRLLVPPVGEDRFGFVASC